MLLELRRNLDDRKITGESPGVTTNNRNVARTET
jgi:hypothetical protein